MINESCLTEMVNFGFLLLSMVNIFKTLGRPCISDFSLLTPSFAINTHKTFKTFCFRQYWDWHTSWFHTDKSFLICKEFLTSITVFVILRNIYLEINCVYLWWLDVEIQKFIFLVFQLFLRDNHFENAPEEGMNPQIFISTLQILIIWALNIQKNIRSFI